MTDIIGNQSLISEEQRRIVLISEAIYSQYYTGSLAPEFRTILTLIMVLVQEPMAFFLYVRDGDQLKGLYPFNKHDRYQNEIRAQLSRPISINNTFQIFGTDYYLLVLHITYRSGHGHAEFKNIKQEPRIPASTLIERLLSDERLTGDRSFVDEIKGSLEHHNNNDNININDYFKPVDADKAPSSKRELKKRAEAYIAAHNLYKSLFNGNDFNVSHKAEIQKSVIARVYRKIKDKSERLTYGKNFSSSRDNIESTHEDVFPTLPNFILMGRDYCHFLDNDRIVSSGRVYSRHSGSYDYRVFFLICHDQEKDFRDYLIRLKDKILSDKAIKKIDHLSRLPYSYSEHMRAHRKHDEKNELKLVDDLDCFFEKSLCECDDGIDQFMVIMKKVFGSGVRSMADPVFNAGVMHFREPFTTSALMRCFPEEFFTYKSFNDITDAIKKEKDEEKRSALIDLLDDLKRVVISHYLFLGMSPCSKSSTDVQGLNRIMLSPIQVGGSVYAVTGFFTVTQDQNKVDFNYWSKIFHLNEIHAKAERELRRWLENLHFNLIFVSFKKAIKEIQSSPKEKLSEKEVNVIFGKHLELLQSIMPYASLEPSFQQHDESGSPTSSGIWLTDKYYITLKPAMSKFYPPIAGENWITAISSARKNYTNIDEIYEFVSKEFSVYAIHQANLKRNEP